jgi:5-(carboxyamino)imidazole ribonucleotide synthase
VKRLGILGGGQLGRMLAMAGIPLDIRCTVLDPSSEPCAALVCDHITGEFDDYQALYQLTQVADVITYEFENVPVETARWLAARVPVYPPPEALEVSQDRVIEKSFFQSLGIPTPAFAAIDSRASFDAGIATVGLPAILKTRRFGYDGKGQFVIRTPKDADAAWQSLGGRPLILEQMIAFDRELSILAVRSPAGQTAYYPLVQNEHRNGMLHKTLAPAPDLAEELFERAAEYAGLILENLQYVGVLAVEWFQDGPRLLANEMAPRVHNSGHFSIEGAAISQFENHLRAVLGLPLGETAIPRPCAMFNLIGQHPPFEQMLSFPQTHLHWYGKDPRPRRKIGHVTILADSEMERDRLANVWEKEVHRPGS